MVIGVVLFFDNRGQLITGNVIGVENQKFIQGETLGNKVCLLDGLGINDDASKIFTCSITSDCISIINEYHEVTGIPSLSQKILDRIECLPRE